MAAYIGPTKLESWEGLDCVEPSPVLSAAVHLSCPVDELLAIDAHKFNGIFREHTTEGLDTQGKQLPLTELIK